MLARIDQDEKTFGKKFLELTDALRGLETHSQTFPKEVYS